ncbi:CBS domain-containing protein [Armatimonas rosea]|uniref:Putative transcriptional regulator n=1 Tax=Armatimonas rosea TaxID=685828 RepID=A0A7W9WAR5_ARMRO|nr:CBS domain-containing protein [Armatimonas rosea]MBB6053897.1 putative transcriptional regulator [Armatimonas rosea]
MNEDILAKRFITTFNFVEQHLRVSLGVPPEARFTQMTQKYFERRVDQKDRFDLDAFASIRNAITHSAEPLFSPSIVAVERIEAIFERMVNPKLIYPRFKVDVDCVALEDTLASVFNTIAQRDFSQFPVYSDKKFHGLLTENGLTRWVAQHVLHTSPSVNLDGATVADVLSLEQSQGTSQFVPKTMTVDEMRYCFAVAPDLEAVLITETGDSTEKLLGIATVYDLLELTLNSKEQRD